MGIQPGARFPARSADALSATLYVHFTQAIYRNWPISTRPHPGRFDGVALCSDNVARVSNTVSSRAPSGQGLTLVHFSAQLEPCLTHKNTLNTLNTP